MPSRSGQHHRLQTYVIPSLSVSGGGTPVWMKSTAPRQSVCASMKGGRLTRVRSARGAEARMMLGTARLLDIARAGRDGVEHA